MVKPIEHSLLVSNLIQISDLTLNDLNSGRLNNYITSVIALTKGGVLPEGEVLGGVWGVIQPPTGETPLASSTQNTDSRWPFQQSPSKFVFGRKSEAELVGVKPELVEVARLALRCSVQDFMVFDGLRTIEEQKSYLAAGTTKTLQSKHLPQKDGKGWAIDLVPVVKGIPKWDWQLIYPVVFAVDLAATHLGYERNIRWGGAWDRTLADFGGRLSDYQEECAAYAQRHQGKDFLDGPHFEWVD